MQQTTARDIKFKSIPASSSLAGRHAGGGREPTVQFVVALYMPGEKEERKKKILGGGVDIFAT